MAKKQRCVVAIITAILLLSISCGASKTSPAPGCNTDGGCFPVMGGCFGKTVIQDFEIKGGGDCLDIRVNNCNGGVLDIRNACDEALIFGALEIPTGNYTILDVRPIADGQFEFLQKSSNFSEFVPDSDQYIMISGTLGDQIVRITFIKTAPLCE